MPINFPVNNYLLKLSNIFNCATLLATSNNYEKLLALIIFTTVLNYSSVKFEGFFI